MEIGFSRSDWLDIYVDMSESAGMDERLAHVADYISTVEVDGEDGYMKEVLDYESAASAGVPARVLALARGGAGLGAAIADRAA